jgi:hypothetical protein
MANTLTPLIHTILARGVSVLRESALLPRLVNLEYSLSPKQKGQTIDVPVSKASSTYDITPSHTDKQASDEEMLYVQVALDSWKGADFHLTDVERTRIEKEENFLPMTIQEKVRALANAINADVLANYYQVYGLVGTAGTTPFSNSTDRTAAKDATSLAAQMDAQLCPRVGRVAVIDTAAEAEALALPYFANADKAGNTDVIVNANIGRKFGTDWFVENAIQSHTAGTPGGTPVVDGAHTSDPSGLTDTIAISGLTITTGDYHQGDVITIAGHSQQYAVQADATADGSGDVTVTVAPGLQTALAGAEAVTLVASHTVNLGFTREAFALVTAPFEGDNMPGVEVASMRDPVTGIVLRLEVKRQYKQTKWEFDVLWGSACVRPQMAVRLAG